MQQSYASLATRQDKQDNVSFHQFLTFYYRLVGI